MQDNKSTKRQRVEDEKKVDPELEFNLRKVTTREKSERRLDSFSMLCEGGMTCAAVTIVNDELLVTTNTIHSNCQRDQRKQIGLEFLQNLLNYFQQLSTSKKNDRAIEIKLLSYIYCAAWQSDNKKNVQSNPNIDENTLFLIINYLLDNNVSTWIKEDNMFFTQFLPEDDRDLFSQERVKRNKKRIDIISKNLTDIRIVFGFLSPYVRHLKKAMHMLVSTNILKNFKILAIGKNEEHAEIRLLGYLIDIGLLQRLVQIKLDEKHYIGISKLCCCHCAKVFEIINTVLRDYSINSEINLNLPDSRSISFENISDEIQHLVEELDDDQDQDVDEHEDQDDAIIRTGGSHGLMVKKWKAPTYAEGDSYIDKGGKDSELPGYVWDARSGRWFKLKLDATRCTPELRNKIKNEFARGLQSLNTMLEKRKKMLKEAQNKTGADDDRLVSFVSQFFRPTVSMWPEMSSSSEEELILIGQQLIAANKFNDKLFDEYDHIQIDRLLSPQNILTLCGSNVLENVLVRPLSALQDFEHRDMTNIRLLSEHLNEIRLNFDHYRPNQVIILPCQMARHFFIVAMVRDGNKFIPWYIHSVNQPLKDEVPISQIPQLVEVTYGDDDVIKCLRSELFNIFNTNEDLKIIRLNQQTSITKLCGAITVQNALDIISGKVNLQDPAPEHAFTIQEPNQAYDIVHKQSQLLEPMDSALPVMMDLN